MWYLELAKNLMPAERLPMTSPGDTKRPRSVKLEIDPDFNATAQAGGILAEQTLRSLGMLKLLATHLPRRGGPWNSPKRFGVRAAPTWRAAGRSRKFV